MRSDERDAGHAATNAPMMPWPRPWTTFAASVAITPRPAARAAAGQVRSCSGPVGGIEWSPGDEEDLW
jgi:hypothetical protein